MCDLIDRQVAIDAFATSTSDGDKVDWCRWVLKQVPSANQWIPCTVRLPLYNTRVLVVDKYNEIDIAELVDYSDVDEPDEWWTYEYKVHDIIAWMPLPDPMEGEE